MMNKENMFSRLVPKIGSTFQILLRNISEFIRTFRNFLRNLYRLLKSPKPPRIIELDAQERPPRPSDISNSTRLEHQEALKVLMEIHSMLGDNRYIRKPRNITHDRLVAQRILDETHHRRQVHYGVRDTSLNRSATDDSPRLLRKTEVWLPTVTTKPTLGGATTALKGVTSSESLRSRDELLDESMVEFSSRSLEKDMRCVVIGTCGYGGSDEFSFISGECRF